MKPLDHLIVALAESFVRGAGGPELGVEVAVTHVDLVLPVEARLGRDGELLASLPRGRMETGFRMPHGTLAARFTLSSKGDP